MEINILGALSLTCGQQSVEVASKRVSTVLTLLALSPGTPIPFDQLVDELWADQPMGNARNALQANVSRLRKLLESVTRTSSDGIVRTASNGYLLDVPAEAVDVHRFAALAAAGAGLVHKDPAEAVEKLERALGLWRGPALMDARDGLRCRVQAAHLEERRLTVYEDLVAAKLAACSERISLPELRQLAADHSERERLTELLMLALYREGRQAEALDVFHGARRRLAAELGLEPGPALHLVYQAILNQDPMLGQPRHSLLYAAPAS